MRIINTTDNVYEVYTNSHILGSSTDIAPRRAVWAYKRFSELCTFHGDILQGALCVL